MFVRAAIKDVLVTLMEAIGLVILVVFVFLRSWRTTIIPSIAVPVSLIGTFAFVKLFGFSINSLTLFGITLATGLLSARQQADRSRKGPDPTRYGDWEKCGRCIDF